MKNIELLTNFTEQHSDDVAELSQILAKIGIDIHLEQSSEPNSGKLIIKYDTDNAEKKLSRSAGRHEKHFEVILTSEIRERMGNGESAESIASELGISRSTFFRKLKKAEELNLLYLS